MITLKDFFKEDGLVAKNLEQFEYRDSQLEMAQLIDQGLENQKHILVEAGTGTGKSMAYLIPLIIHSILNKEKIIISTNTKSLQQQIIKKDLPFLKKIFNQGDMDFTFKILYGSNNYICLRKSNEFLIHTYFNFYLSHPDKEYLLEYIQDYKNSGIRFDLEINVETQIWYNLNRDSDLCLRKECSFFNDCFYYKHIKELVSTDIIVVNHHLFFAHIKSGYNILPKFKLFVWDEAHNIEDIASRFLAEVVSEVEINFILKKILSFKGESDWLDLEPKETLKINDEIKTIENYFNEFFQYMKDHFNTNKRIKEEKIPDEIINQFKHFIGFIQSYFKLLAQQTEEVATELDLLYKKLSQIHYNLEFFIKHNNEEYVYWVEKLGKKQMLELKYTPINIAQYLESKVFKMYQTGILTSATLSTNNNFDFLKSRLGITECIEKIFPSPFNFKKQVQLFMNRKIASPVEYKKYITDISTEIIKLLQITQGKAFILFTSYDALQQVKKNIENEITYRLLVQNDKPSHDLLQEFKEDIHSVLLGTLSFWEGVDVPGEALSMVVITRLPFDVPDDPLISARIEYIQKHKGNPFIEYQLPNAIILLRQGFGRLIRNSQDKGIVAILDSRIVNKSYGRLFLNSLPECDVMDV